MPVVAAQPKAEDAVARFVLRSRRPRANKGLTAVSLFSGGGLSDAGYLAAGYSVVVQAELEPKRAEIGKANFPDSTWVIGDVRRRVDQIVRAYRKKEKRPLDLLVATPPCQGLSSSNPSRGKRASEGARKNARKNALLLRIIQVARRLKPRVIVAENVRQILTHAVYWNGTKRTVVEVLKRELTDYEFWHMAVDVADFGVPQSRTRAVIVGIRKTEKCVAALVKAQVAPIPAPTHCDGGGDNYLEWVSIRQWCKARGYASLDASEEAKATGKDPLHNVPWYDAERYRLIADIPKHSGKSAYDNDTCPNCQRRVAAVDKAKCSRCKGVLWNRPIKRGRGRPRLIKGFLSSYRRMRSDRPAATITTNSSHVGSDWKIHPYENRVLSARECADLQTVPRWYGWRKALKSKQKYLVRNLIGEALPPYFTFLHGRVLASLLKTGKVRCKVLVTPAQ
jgi:DNA (cytosine-5)-methyltransferase 1